MTSPKEIYLLLSPEEFGNLHALFSDLFYPSEHPILDGAYETLPLWEIYLKLAEIKKRIDFVARYESENSALESPF